MEKYASIWKKDTAFERYNDALLFIKESGITAADVEKYAPIATGTLAGGIAGYAASRKHKKNSKGLSAATVDRIATDAYNQKAEQLGTPQPKGLVTDIKKRIAKLQEENPKLDVAAATAVAGTLAGVGVHKRLKSIKADVLKGMK